jgi:NTP pyrophosphatase (non-canonical NTP hydrolase)
MPEVSLIKYQGFVKEVTSNASNDVEVLIERLRELNKEANISLLLTGAAGLASEGGEFGELVKKCTFQGKPLDEATKHHMKRELGDIGWYWINACRALNLDPNDVIRENVHKLESRYPGGEFNVHSSENRDANDL